MSDDPLVSLRDVEVPPPVSFFPPAPGWWVLALLCISVLGILFWYIFSTRERRNLLKEAKQFLENIEYRYLVKKNSEEAFRELSKFTRRLVLSLSNDKRVASIQGFSWLDFLAKLGGKSSMRSGPMSLLVNNPYRFNIDDDPLELIEVLKIWLKGIPKREKTIRLRIANWFNRNQGSESSAGGK